MYADQQSTLRNQKRSHRKQQIGWSKDYILFAQFLNWRVAEEIHNKVIHLNAWQQVNLVVSQMFSKEIMDWRT